MIKKYTALCLSVISMYISTADNPIPRRVPEIFFIDQDSTVRMQTIEEGLERLKLQLTQEIRTIAAKHEQEHKTQYERHEREYEKIRKDNEQSITVKLRENAIFLDQQHTEFKERSERQLTETKKISDQLVNRVQDTLNSSITYQLAKLNLKTAEFDLDRDKKDLEKMDLCRKGLYVTTPILSLSAISTYQDNWRSGLFATLISGVILGSAYYYVTDQSNSIESKILHNEEKVKELKTILISSQLATENKENENIQDNNEESHV